MRNFRREGGAAERLAGMFLEQNGVQILERNFRSGRSGEIDLIGLDGRTLVFFEVKFRNSEGSGTPEEAVTFAKQKTICRTADYYRYRHQIPEEQPVRFDVVALRPAGEGKISCHWVRNAFSYHI